MPNDDDEEITSLGNAFYIWGEFLSGYIKCEEGYRLFAESKDILRAVTAVLGTREDYNHRREDNWIDTSRRRRRISQVKIYVDYRRCIEYT